MARLRCQISTSVDGFVAGPNPDEREPLGIERALELAREAAGGKDVALAGGAEAIQQYLAAGLLDELTLTVSPVLLGSGTRLFDERAATAELDLDGVVDGPDATHLRYRVGRR